MTVEEATNSNWAASAGFVGLALGLTVGLVFGTWVVVRIWRYVVRELRESVRKDGLEPAPEQEDGQA
jgi:hypothetical protein